MELINVSCNPSVSHSLPVANFIHCFKEFWNSNSGSIRSGKFRTKLHNIVESSFINVDWRPESSIELGSSFKDFFIGNGFWSFESKPNDFLLSVKSSLLFRPMKIFRKLRSSKINQSPDVGDVCWSSQFFFPVTPCFPLLLFSLLLLSPNTSPESSHLWLSSLHSACLWVCWIQLKLYSIIFLIIKYGILEEQTQQQQQLKQTESEEPSTKPTRT